MHDADRGLKERKRGDVSEGGDGRFKSLEGSTFKCLKCFFHDEMCDLSAIIQ